MSEWVKHQRDYLRLSNGEIICLTEIAWVTTDKFNTNCKVGFRNSNQVVQFDVKADEIWEAIGEVK